jgi:hypothetical protein
LGGLLLLLFGVAYLALCVWVGKWATRRMQGAVRTKVVGAAVAVVLLALPTADGIWGNFRLHALCDSVPRTELLGTVVIPKTLLGVRNRPPQLDEYGNVDWKQLATYVKHGSAESTVETLGIRMQKVTDVLVRVSDGEAVARMTHFYYRGGWLRTSSDGVGAASCTPDVGLESLLPLILKGT